MIGQLGTKHPWVWAIDQSLGINCDANLPNAGALAHETLQTGSTRIFHAAATSYIGQAQPWWYTARPNNIALRYWLRRQ